MIKAYFYIFICFFLFSTQSIYAQEDSPSELLTYIYIDEPPSFPGGDIALINFIYSRLQYPEKARELNIEGRVFVRFYIASDGSLFNFELLKDIGGGCGDEAIRILKMMPNWKPAFTKNQYIKTPYVIPINFRLELENDCFQFMQHLFR